MAYSDFKLSELIKTLFNVDFDKGLNGINANKILGILLSTIQDTKIDE